MDSIQDSVKESKAEAHKSNLRKEPSFSRWCDEDGLERSNGLANDAEIRGEDADFELPSPKSEHESKTVGREREANHLVVERENEPLSPSFRQRSVAHLNGSHNSLHFSHGSFSDRGDMEHMTLRDENGGIGKRYASLEVESEHGKMLSSGLWVTTGREPDSLAPNIEEREQRGISAVSLIRTLIYILVWYTFSTFLTLYNKSLLGDKLGKFPAPLLMNTVHFAMQAVFSRLILWYWSMKSGGTMSWTDYFIRVVPTAIATALDINLSNASLVFISVTFATMCKSASPIFLLLFAFAFRLESLSIKLLGIILVISIGVLLTVVKETEFELWGFIFVMLAAVMSGFRWCMTQILLQKESYGLKNPLALMSYVTPVMALATGLLSLMFDPWLDFRRNDYFYDSWHVLRSSFLMLIGGSLAFFMVLTEYVLISATSAVTVTIAGVVKEAVTILVAVFYFHDQFTLLKGIGLLTIMIGVSLFNWYKYLKLKHAHPGENDKDAGLSNTNGAAKYVILDNMEDQDEGP